MLRPCLMHSTHHPGALRPIDLRPIDLRPTALRLVAVSLAACLFGCANAGEAERENFDERTDLGVQYLSTDINNGVSGEIEFTIPPGAESVLIEVRGSKGRYYLTKFVTPLGRDLIEAGQFVTRGARELPGLVTWMYPNAPGAAPEAGDYRLLIRAEDGSGGHIGSESLDVRVYTKQPALSGCGFHLDFLVADDAIVAADVEPMVDRLISNLNQQYAGADVGFLDHTTSLVHLPTADLELGGNPASVISEVDDVMRAARQDGDVRSQALHILLVRSLGGDLRGYAMGLPGPLSADLATSVVLVASASFIDRDGYLDVDAMAETVAHEIGHYLGLYHTSEGDRQFHDPIADTPECTETDCPADFWINLMTPGGFERTELTAGQAEIIRHHPLCTPANVNPEPTTCDLVCQPPETCALRQGQAACAPACDPNGEPCAGDDACAADDLGKFVCTSAP